MDPNMLIIIVILVVLLIIAFISFKKEKQEKTKEKLETMASRLQDKSQKALVISAIEQEYKDLIQDRFGDQGLQFYISNLKPVTCVIPPDLSLMDIEYVKDKNKRSPEFERLRQCGYIHNIALLMLSLTAWAWRPDLDFDGFKKLIEQLIKEDIFNINTPPTQGYYSRYGRYGYLYPQYY
jgi:hypothetical protein